MKLDGQFVKHMIKRALVQYGGEHEEWITNEMLHDLYIQVMNAHNKTERPLHELVQDIVYEYVTNYAKN